MHMKEVIVSVRMPESMLKELKELAVARHFLDVSEEIRSIIRDKTKEYSQPYQADLKRIADDIAGELNKKTQEKHALIGKLRTMLEELENG